MSRAAPYILDSMFTTLVRIAALMFLSVALYASDPQAESQARKVMDEFMAAFNASNTRGWAAALNYPHVRLASNSVRVYANADEYARENDMESEALKTRLGRMWHHSRWASLKVIQSGKEKVHFAVVFIRYDVTTGRSAGFLPCM
jgi:hypothetical protein